MRENPTELSRLGRSAAEVIGLVNELIKKQVCEITIKKNLDIKQHGMTSMPGTNWQKPYLVNSLREAM